MLLGLGKIISGALSLSVFACMNGCYTLGMTAARYCALAGTVRSKERKNQYFYYRLAGAVMVAASLLYRCQCMGRNKIPEVPFPSASRAEDYQPGDFADLAGADPVSDSCVCR